MRLHPREAREWAAGKDELSTSAPKREQKESSAKQEVTKTEKHLYTSSSSPSKGQEVLNLY